MTLEERVARLGIRKDRADTILSAGLIIGVFAEKFLIKRVLVPGLGYARRPYRQPAQRCAQIGPAYE